MALRLAPLHPLFAAEAAGIDLRRPFLQPPIRRRSFLLVEPSGIVSFMSKVEGIKEELGWLKVVFAVLVAIDVSLVAWVAQNYGAANDVLVIVAIVAVAVLTAVIVWVNRLAYRKIRELENL